MVYVSLVSANKELNCPLTACVHSFLFLALAVHCRVLTSVDEISFPLLHLIILSGSSLLWGLGASLWLTLLLFIVIMATSPPLHLTSGLICLRASVNDEFRTIWYVDRFNLFVPRVTCYVYYCQWSVSRLTQRIGNVFHFIFVVHNFSYVNSLRLCIWRDIKFLCIPNCTGTLWCLVRLSFRDFLRRSLLNYQYLDSW